MITNIREVMFSQQEDDIINQLYPDPDQMTYEQLLELQDKIGFVNRGLTQAEINVTHILNYFI
jgi:hypothetical protein